MLNFIRLQLNQFTGEKNEKYSSSYIFNTGIFIVCMGAIKPSYAAIGAITKADLSGNWVITLNGNTGCGLVSMLVNVTLNTAGVGTASIQTHSISGSPSGCEGTITSQSFTIDSLNIAGTGKASLSCGVGCGWNFDIQVAPDRSIFNLVDVNPLNPNNLLNGVAIHKNN